MIIIRCPHCNELRHELELEHGGEAGIDRPASPEAVSDEVWVDYLFLRRNPKGILAELWCCRGGCQQWFKVARDTVSHAVIEVVPVNAGFSLAGREQVQ